jgi:hypothetical protein
LPSRQEGVDRVKHRVVGSILRTAPSALVEKQTGFTEGLNGLLQPVAYQGTQLLRGYLFTGEGGFLLKHHEVGVVVGGGGS